MSDIAIRVENLSKQYKLGATIRHDRLKDLLTHSLNGLFARSSRSSLNSQASTLDSRRSDTIWALKDVSFEVKQGETLGIIGANGAGKSTLLKILSRITEPTDGRAQIYGRVGSLLEVGTGFDGELTGRENVYLNGAILGMTKREIDRKFDEIVDFAGVNQFVDTPIKRYSSGMKVRLAFAVAAQLEPEILIVDEVLAVGDAAFQKKCLNKMSKVAKEGRTVLFVSHNMGAIENLCQSAIWLDSGSMARYGSVVEITNDYLSSAAGETTSLGEWKRTGTGEAQIRRVCLLDSKACIRDTFRMGETLIFRVDVEFVQPLRDVDLSLQIRSVDTRVSILHIHNRDSGFTIEAAQPSARSFTIEIPDCLLYPGLYSVSVWVGKRGLTFDKVEDALHFGVSQSNASMRTTPFYKHLGVIHHRSTWKEV